MIKIKYFLSVIINLLALVGLYIVLHDLTESGKTGILPRASNLGIFLPWAWYALPLGGIHMILQAQKWKKFLGFIYLVGTVGVFYLLGQALV